MKRIHVAKEILETEKNYVTYLKITISVCTPTQAKVDSLCLLSYPWKHYIDPLETMYRTNPKTAFLTLEDIGKVFSVIRC